MRANYTILLLALFMCIGAHTEAQEQPRKVRNIALENQNNQRVYIPYWGEKNLLIFYIDPEVATQNDDLLNYISSSECITSSNIKGLGIVNLKDAVYPNWMVRKIINARNVKSNTTILYDRENLISNAWDLGNCNNKFVTILINKSGELIYFYKGAMPKSEQRRFIAIAQRLM
ncbi:MAG: hypothetical protein J6U48_03525 [Alistipes sp.]|nr:hypothetical protein [Alistipes sp.]